MILVHASHVMFCTRMLAALAALAASAVIILADAKHAAAFCVENGTDMRLLFTARLKGNADRGLIFSQWVEARSNACGTPNHGPDILEVFVFADDDSVEGCDDEIAAAGVLHLSKFEEFDNCIWGK
jgi:hypothetical protein